VGYKAGIIAMRRKEKPQRRDECDALPRTGTIQMSDPAERARWAKGLGVTESVLQQAIRIVGNSIAELRKLFCQD
jgi:hypothetical protein